jgi:ABC transporter substrate binding protein
MRRRDFIKGVAGGAAAWPLAARAQQRERMRRIGVLTPFAADDTEGHGRLTAFAQGLQQLGWTVGQNLRIDYRWGDGKADTMRKHAVELVALAPDVILSDSSAATAPLLQATHTIPIVFGVVADPVGAGYIESLARPGGNATGFTPFEYSIAGKWLELLKEVAPRITDQTAQVAVYAVVVDGGQSVSGGQRDDQIALGSCCRASRHTMRPAFGPCANAVTERSISAASRTSTWNRFP